MRKVAVVILVAIVAIITLVIIHNGVRTIDTGERGVLLHYGALDSGLPLKPGFYVVNPFIDSVVPVDVRIKVVSTVATAASKDLQDVSAKIAVNYHPDPDSVGKIYQTLGLNFPVTVIAPAIQESVKQVTAQYTAEQLITKRDEVKNKIENSIQSRMRPYGIVIDQVSITDFTFSQSFSDAIEAKVRAAQEVLTEQNVLQKTKIIAEQKVATASGNRNSTIQEAQGKAESIRIIQEQLAKSPLYVQYLVASEWDGQLPKIMGANTDPLITLPSTIANLSAPR